MARTMDEVQDRGGRPPGEGARAEGGQAGMSAEKREKLRERGARRVLKLNFDCTCRPVGRTDRRLVREAREAAWGIVRRRREHAATAAERACTRGSAGRGRPRRRGRSCGRTKAQGTPALSSGRSCGSGAQSWCSDKICVTAGSNEFSMMPGSNKFSMMPGSNKFSMMSGSNKFSMMAGSNKFSMMAAFKFLFRPWRIGINNTNNQLGAINGRVDMVLLEL